MLAAYKSQETLAFLRVTVFGCWLIIAILFSASNYAQLPIEIFEPWGFHAVINFLQPETLHIILSAPFLLFLKIGTIIGCSLLIAGVRPFRTVAIVTVIFIFLLDFVIRGFNGYINHGQIVIYFAAIFLCFSAASNRWSLFGKDEMNQSPNKYSFPIILTATTFSFVYAFIGIRRFVRGGMEIFTNDALLIYTVRNSLNYSNYGFELGLVLIEFDLVIVLLKTGFFIVTMMEVLTPYILFNRYLRYSWLVVMIPFHFSTLFTMNIFFWENILLILVLYVNWQGVHYRFLKVNKTITTRVMTAANKSIRVISNVTFTR
ncbi:hypothetical protein DYD21_13165 [Rhodohalobacter sp. SW132]|nr:hypothetical protein DYD21_13165 [Rhodohalobacter sp. SW132]